MRRILALACFLLVLPALLSAPASAQTPPPAPQVIAAGVSAGGTDLSGLDVVAAAQRLYESQAAILGQPIRVNSGGRRFTLWIPRLKLAYDVGKTARRAYRAGLKANGKPVDIKLSIRYDRARVRAFAQRVARKVARPARNATAHVALTKVSLTPGVRGRAVDVAKLIAAVRQRVVDARPAREFRFKRAAVHPAVATRDLRRRYSTVITIDRAHFRLRLFKGFRLFKSYSVAVGQPAFPTPTGLYSIVSKQVNPIWSVPNSPWAGELAGTTVEGGSAANPLKARWMGIVNGVGIHGTGEDASIGTRASHGCIRMHVPDVVDLFNRTPIGTPVLIA